MRCCAESWNSSLRGGSRPIDALRNVGHPRTMQLTAVFVPAPEGGFTAFVEEIPGAISEGETIEEARENLSDALRMVLECNRELARENEPGDSVREALELATV